MDYLFTYGPPTLLGLLLFTIVIVTMIRLRYVVPTNDVVVVQSSKRTTSYGKGLPAGNTFYCWPAWMPIIGVQITRLPVSVFSMSLQNYPGYDKDRVPFTIDIIGFFRIHDSNTAAERLANFTSLKEQLDGILKGAMRAILAASDIQEILGGRAKFGEDFTVAVDSQLAHWGVQSVKNIELMDIRDAEGSSVIANIMAKKKSKIESESRIEVANNMQEAKTKEIEATRQVGLAEQEAQETVGKRQAEKDKTVGIAKQLADQAIKTEMATTATKTMDVTKVEQVRQAEISKEVAVVAAQQQRDVSIALAEGTKQQTVLVADGNLESKKREAEGNFAVGEAKAKAETLLLMAPVTAQIALADKIGSSEGYQRYLVLIRQMEVNEHVGIEQAKALEKATVKVFANAGSPSDGLKSVMDLVSTRGGQQIGAAVEAFMGTEAGADLAAILKPTSTPTRPMNGAA